MSLSPRLEVSRKLLEVIKNDPEQLISVIDALTFKLSKRQLKEIEVFIQWKDKERRKKVVSMMNVE